MPLDRPGRSRAGPGGPHQRDQPRRTSGAVSGSTLSPPLRLPCPTCLVSERWRGDQAQHGNKQQRIVLAPHRITPPALRGRMYGRRLVSTSSYWRILDVLRCLANRPVPTRQMATEADPHPYAR
jgi:hypothetical protein